MDNKASHSGRERLLRDTTTSGMLWAAAGTPLALALAQTDFDSWVFWVGVITSIAYQISALAIRRYPVSGRLAATGALAGTFILLVPSLLLSPLAALLSLLVGTSCLVLLWKVGAPLIELSRVRRRPLGEGLAQGASMVALSLWLVLHLFDLMDPVATWRASAWALGSASILGAIWAVGILPVRRLAGCVTLVALGIACGVVAWSWGDWMVGLSGFAAPCAVISGLARHTPRRSFERSSWWEPLLGHPERLFVGTFVLLCCVGTLLLASPLSATGPDGVGLIDAAFTATSAVCVTGLIVRDTPVEFSVFGQAMLLLLIQIGGLGIMTFSTAALWALGKRMSLRHESAVASLISTQDRGRLFATAKNILYFTMVCECVGAILLALGFWLEGDSFTQAAWRGLFTSISAFCNAGFALQSDSLVPYQGNPWILHTVGLIIVAGGLSPLAAFALPSLMLRRAQPVSAQAKLALAATAILLITGFVFYLALEWNASLGGLAVDHKIHNAWFQSITLRTAGFNSVDLAAAHPATFVLMLVWMFIGGCPGGTAGGVKTTTIAVLALSVIQGIRGQWRVQVFGKTISERTRAKAAVVVALAAGSGLLALLVVLLTQTMSPHLAVFEVVSALGTVGLSIGGTAELDGIGKTIIGICMFVGRVGGLSLLMFLSSRRAPATIGRPEEDVDVG